MRHLSWTLALLLVVTRAEAREQALTFAQAADAAAGHPLAASGKKASEQLAAASRSSPSIDSNPVISIQAGPRVLPAKERMLEGMLSLSQSISLEKGPQARRQALAAEARTAEEAARTQRMAVRLQAARAWLDLWAAQRQLGLAQQDQESARRLQRAVEALVAARERTKVEALVAKRQSDEAALRVLAAEGALAEARAQLKGELGLASDVTPVARGELPEVAPPGEGEQQAALASADRMPEVKMKALLAAEERVKAIEERAARGSRVTVGAQVQRDAVGATVVYGMLSMPLGLADMSGREEAARKAAALRAEGESEAALRRARAELLSAYHEVEHTDEVMRAIEGGLLPSAEQAASSLDRAFAAGEVTLLERLDGQRGVTAARMQQVGAARDRAWARIRAATLTQAAQGGQP